MPPNTPAANSGRGLDKRHADAASALRMATLDAAQALDLDGEIGSIEPGKQADLAAMRFDDPETQPLYDPIAQLVYAGARQQVHWVWIAGEAKLRERELTGMDLPGILARAREWRERIVRLPRPA